MIDLTKLNTKELVALFNQLSSGTITRFESHTVGVDRVTKLVARMQADEATVLKAMEAAGLEVPPGCDISATAVTDVPAEPEATATVAAPLAVAPVATIPQQDEDQTGAASAESDTVGAGVASGNEVQEAESSAPPKEELNENDRRVLGYLTAIGPCKVGAIRDRWKTDDHAFAKLAPTQQKGRIRKSVRKLESAALISKEGMIFTVRAS